VLGSSSTIRSVVRLKGGQHAATWRVDTPAGSVVVREFPAGDAAAAHEAQVLRLLDGLGGLAPVLLGSDLAGRWSPSPTLLISCLDGTADITPSDPHAWARELGRALARVHAVPSEQISALPSVFSRNGEASERLEGPAAEWIRSSWPQLTGSPEVLTHSDYWSGNVVWRHDAVTGIVDWSGGCRAPRGYDVGWCRLDLYLLYDDSVADVFLAAYQDGIGHPLSDIALWDAWALARSHAIVDTWTPNYEPLGRPDLDEHELRRRHEEWTHRLLKEQQGSTTAR
jgi:Ser/Thr protein kinase RdoA (MazF antagonist)